MNWAVLENEEAKLAADKAAARVAREFKDYVELEDAMQDAYILLADKAHRYEVLVSEGKTNLITHEIYCDLVNLVKPDVAKRRNLVSLDALREKELG